MSIKSASACKHFLNSAVFDRAAFVTLTYRYNMQNDKQAYSDLRKLQKRLCARFGECCTVWRKELQERGAIHFHVFTLDPPEGWSHDAITEEWMDITEQEGDIAARLYGVYEKTFDVIQDKDAGVIINYLVKYATKNGQASRGKNWGILNRKAANVREERREVSEVSALALADVVTSAGGYRRVLDGGGVQYSLFFGHMGNERDRRGIDSFSVAIAMVDEVT